MQVPVITGIDIVLGSRHQWLFFLFFYTLLKLCLVDGYDKKKTILLQKFKALVLSLKFSW